MEIPIFNFSAFFHVATNNCVVIGFGPIGIHHDLSSWCQLRSC